MNIYTSYDGIGIESFDQKMYTVLADFKKAVISYLEPLNEEIEREKGMITIKLNLSLFTIVEVLEFSPSVQSKIVSYLDQFQAEEILLSIYRTHFPDKR